MNTILVSTDLSAASKNAAEYAARLCKKWDAKMILLNVVMAPVPVSDVPFTYEETGEIQAEFEKVLTTEASRLFGMFDIEIEHSVELGLPDIDIIEYAKEKKAGLIVMGMRHADGLDKMLGTTTNSVARKSAIPVLIIPEGYAFNGIRSIAYATDLNSETRSGSFGPIKELADAFGASLHIVHVQKPDEIVSQEDIDGKIKLALASEGINNRYHTVKDKDIEHGIRRFLDANPVDMLAMTAHRHNLLERLFGKRHTKSILYQTDLPLLVLHDKAQ